MPTQTKPKPPSERFQVVPAVYLMLLRNNGQEILMLQRHNTGYKDGMYSLVAGHIDGNETATDTMVREATEEAGITLAKDDLTFAHIMHRFAEGSERIDLFFTAVSWQGTVTNQEPHKCSELDWYPVNKLPEQTIPYIKYAIESFKSGRYFSEYDERGEG